jgi:uncharacterized spore protein YtfJ
MSLQDLMATTRGTMTVKTVFGEPVERDGTTVLPAAVISGGGGAGAGKDDKGGEGEGGGFGVYAQPVGAFVINNGEVRWRPAVDVNRLVSLAGRIVLVYLFTRVARRKSANP